MSRDRSGRGPLLEALHRASRQLTNQNGIYTDAVAAKLGLNRTDLDCLSIVHLAGSATAGELAEITGLTTGAVTGVIDRLVQAGYVRRDADPDDRRRVIVRAVPDRAAPSGSCSSRCSRPSKASTRATATRSSPSCSTSTSACCRSCRRRRPACAGPPTTPVARRPPCTPHRSATWPAPASTSPRRRPRARARRQRDGRALPRRDRPQRADGERPGGRRDRELQAHRLPLGPRRADGHRAQPRHPVERGGARRRVAAARRPRAASRCASWSSPGASATPR